MFSTLRGFLNRHRKKFIIATVLVGGGTLAISYAQRRLREWQERETKAFLDMTRKKQHFDSTERTCNQTVLSLATAVNERVMRALDTDEILSLLRSNPDNKTQLWEELKVLTFARVSALIYSYTILVVTLRIQLNIVGGYLYKDSIKYDTPPLINSELQQRYLSLCHYFVADGVDKLCKLIKTKVKSVIEPISLKQKLTLRDTEQLFWSVQAALCTDNSDPLRQMVSFLIGENNIMDDEIFKTMLNETMDLLESDEVSSIAISSVSRGFSLLFDQIAEFFNTGPAVNGKVSPVDSSNPEISGNSDRSNLNPFVNINSIELPLIKLIPIVNCLISQASDKTLSGTPHAIIQQLVLNEKLKLLGANVYEVFSN